MFTRKSVFRVADYVRHKPVYAATELARNLKFLILIESIKVGKNKSPGQPMQLHRRSVPLFFICAKKSGFLMISDSLQSEIIYSSHTIQTALAFFSYS